MADQFGNIENKMEEDTLRNRIQIEFERCMQTDTRPGDRTGYSQQQVAKGWAKTWNDVEAGHVPTIPMLKNQQAAWKEQNYQNPTLETKQAMDIYNAQVPHDQRCYDIGEFQENVLKTRRDPFSDAGRNGYSSALKANIESHQEAARIMMNDPVFQMQILRRK